MCVLYYLHYNILEIIFLTKYNHFSLNYYKYNFYPTLMKSSKHIQFGDIN